ncbi:MAG: DUF6770 family protein, partial [Bacteroidota bacterium]
IMNGNNISGYYLFYEVDKIDKEMRTYMLQILDENLEEVSRKRMRNSKNVYLADAAFNDSLIMLKFHDFKEKKYTFKAYDLNGERAKGGSRKLDKKTYAPPLFLQGKKGDSHDGALFAVPRKGFVQYAAVKNKKWGYIIDFLGGSREKSWKYRSDKNADIIHFTNHITANEEMILVNVSKAKNGFGKNVNSALLALDVATGDKIFEVDFEPEKPIQIVNGFIDEIQEEIIIFGMFYKEGAKTFKAKSQGLFAYSLDFKGNVKSQRYISWEEDVSQFIKMNKNGKMKNSEYLAFHNIVRTADGKILVVGEQYSKKVDGGKIAGGILSGLAAGALAGATGGNVGTSGAGPTTFSKFVIDDLMVFTLDAQLNLESVETIEKGQTEMELPGAFMSPQVLAYFAYAYNAFDYAFTQHNEDESIITFGYLDYERVKGEKNGYALGSVSYIDGELSTDKIPLNRDAAALRILPAIPGYVAIFEVIAEKKKGKGLKKKWVRTLNMRLEKINY